MNGVIVINKPKGFTSHDCVNKVRRILKTKKVGHTGTLDPLATGVLPLCIGEATKIVQFLQADNKAYICEMKIGCSTDTDDVDGEVIDKDLNYKEYSKEQIKEVLNSFLGTSLQTVPKYSAVKVNGKKLYEYARKGQEVTLPQRNITISKIELLTNEEVFSGEEITFSFYVECSKGTYIRSLVVDIAKKLNTYAHMTNLKRTTSGMFTLKDSVTIDELEDLFLKNELKFVGISDAIKASLPGIVVSDDLLKRIKNGAKLAIEELKIDSMTAIYNNNVLVAIYDVHPNDKNVVKPIRVFN